MRASSEDFFDSLLTDAVEEMDAKVTHHPTTKAPMAFNSRSVRLTQDQADLLREAERSRGMLGVNHQGPSYLACAVLAFVAHDLGLSFQEVVSGAKDDVDPDVALRAKEIARSVRGDWEIGRLR